MTRHSVFFGDVALDEYYVAAHFPEAGDKVIVQALEPEFGGSVANAASIFAHYGAPTSFIGQLNSGALTQRLLAQLREQGVDTRFTIFDETVPDSHCIVLLSRGEHIVLIPTLGITHTEITPEAFEHMAEAEFVVTTLTDAKPFRMDGLGAPQVLDALRDRGVKIVLDLDVYNEENQGSGLVEHCDLVFMNSLGAERFAGSGGSIDRLLEGGALAVIVTRAGEGCELHTPAGRALVPGIPVEVVDVTGAGDTFTSSFLWALSAGSDLLSAATFANAAAARAVGTVGARAGVASREDVEEFLRSHSPVTSMTT
ncbi:MAG TPA: carbohydrate kinase family protein [Amnibacterium sp.]|jgi:sugar/nucleoside kinase (ribokinase family)|nr:carbohydrate kinase family protein [Amnibacterium sp.]